MILLLVLGVQQRGVAKEPARGIAFGMFRVLPSVKLQTRWEDNVDKTMTGRRADQALLISPTVKFMTRWRNSAFTIDLGSSHARHRETGADNDYDDQSLTLALNLSPKRTLTSNWTYGFKTKHDDKSEVNSGAYSQQSLGGTTTLALTRLETVFGYDYATRRSTRAANRSVDPTRHAVLLGLRFQPAAKTSLFTSLGWAAAHHDDSDRDNGDRKLDVEWSWQATAKTGGRVGMGWIWRDYASAADTAATTLKALIDWRPRRETTVTLTAGRSLEDGGVTDRYFMSNTGGVGLNHRLTQAVALKGNAGIARDRYATAQRDRKWTMDVGFGYVFPRWVILDAQLGHEVKRSTAAGAGYDSNSVMLSLSGGL